VSVTFWKNVNIVISAGIQDAVVCQAVLAAWQHPAQHISTITNNDISCRSSAVEAAAAVAGCIPTEQHPEMWQLISRCRLVRKQVRKSLDSQQLRADQWFQLSHLLLPRCTQSLSTTHR